MTPPSDKKDKKNLNDAFSNFANDLASIEKEDMKAKQDILKEGIERIESEDSDNIIASKMITAQLSKLREKADLSPFVGTSGKIKSPRLKRGEFIQLLARELLYIGREELKKQGAIISLEKLEQYFTEKRENWELRDNDISEALNWLIDEELIPPMEKIDEKKIVVKFRPIELSTDTKEIMKAATGIEATKSTIQSILGWEETRLITALKQLEKDGVVIIDGENIYFPGF